MRIHAIRTGSVALHPRQLRGEGGPERPLRTLLQREWTEPLPIYAWAIEHPEGVIVVDTGERAAASDPGHFPRWHPYFRLAVRIKVRPEEEIGPGLRRAGIEPGDVRKVVLTHMHTDHAGGLHHFRGTEILVARAELDAARGRGARLAGYLPQHWPDWFDPTPVDPRPDAFGPFPDSLPLTEAGDVRLVATPGHTPGHCSVVVDEGERVVFLAGDTSYTQALMLEGAVDGVTNDPKAELRSQERIRSLCAQRPTVYLPTHDPGSADRLEARAAVSV